MTPEERKREAHRDRVAPVIMAGLLALPWAILMDLDAPLWAALYATAAFVDILVTVDGY